MYMMLHVSGVRTFRQTVLAFIKTKSFDMFTVAEMHPLRQENLAMTHSGYALLPLSIERRQPRDVAAGINPKNIHPGISETFIMGRARKILGQARNRSSYLHRHSAVFHNTILSSSRLNIYDVSSDAQHHTHQSKEDTCRQGNTTCFHATYYAEDRRVPHKQKSST